MWIVCGRMDKSLVCVCVCHPAPTLRLCVINMYLLAWWILMRLSFASFVLNALLLPLKQWFFTCTKRTRMHFLQLIMSCGAGVAVGVRETGAIFTVVVVGVFWIFRFFSLKNSNSTWVFWIRRCCFFQFCHNNENDLFRFDAEMCVCVWICLFPSRIQLIIRLLLSLIRRGTCWNIFGNLSLNWWGRSKQWFVCFHPKQKRNNLHFLYIILIYCSCAIVSVWMLLIWLSALSYLMVCSSSSVISWYTMYNLG